MRNTIIFLALNFLALAIGGQFTGSGVSSDWYQTINKAPWTPPGWVFGAAWTTIMICYAFYLKSLIENVKSQSKTIYILYGIQWVLNIIWNPIFFYFQYDVLALLVISALQVVLIITFLRYFRVQHYYNLLLLPYLIWLFTAISLNAYIVFYN
jgi:tryptophan-rich sensory protein